ncbi:hypothetical protein B0T19DRAFT_445221 [Cercophora scortea]|uniref:Uncharacterized protein n=1 Tax=Cercophora scortea TaxID=314031 RepID=A0AAE0IB60_9PEZI|nr:hypothetical protein B0T19DRAFT_445221 [Cercophora scortea]
MFPRLAAFFGGSDAHQDPPAVMGQAPEVNTGDQASYQFLTAEDLESIGQVVPATQPQQTGTYQPANTSFEGATLSISSVPEIHRPMPWLDSYGLPSTTQYDPASYPLSAVGSAGNGASSYFEPMPIYDNAFLAMLDPALFQQADPAVEQAPFPGQHVDSPFHDANLTQLEAQPMGSSVAQDVQQTISHGHEQQLGFQLDDPYAMDWEPSPPTYEYSQQLAPLNSLPALPVNPPNGPSSHEANTDFSHTGQVLGFGQNLDTHQVPYQPQGSSSSLSCAPESVYPPPFPALSEPPDPHSDTPPLSESTSSGSMPSASTSSESTASASASSDDEKTINKNTSVAAIDAYVGRDQFLDGKKWALVVEKLKAKIQERVRQDPNAVKNWLLEEKRKKQAEKKKGIESDDTKNYQIMYNMSGPMFEAVTGMRRNDLWYTEENGGFVRRSRAEFDDVLEDLWEFGSNPILYTLRRKGYRSRTIKTLEKFKCPGSPLRQSAHVDDVDNVDFTPLDEERFEFIWNQQEAGDDAGSGTDSEHAPAGPSKTFTPDYSDDDDSFEDSLEESDADADEDTDLNEEDMNTLWPAPVNAANPPEHVAVADPAQPEQAADAVASPAQPEQAAVAVAGPSQPEQAAVAVADPAQPDQVADANDEALNHVDNGDDTADLEQHGDFDVSFDLGTTITATVEAFEEEQRQLAFADTVHEPQAEQVSAVDANQLEQLGVGADAFELSQLAAAQLAAANNTRTYQSQSAAVANQPEQLPTSVYDHDDNLSGPDAAANDMGQPSRITNQPGQLAAPNSFTTSVNDHHFTHTAVPAAIPTSPSSYFMGSSVDLDNSHNNTPGEDMDVDDFSVEAITQFNFDDNFSFGRNLGIVYDHALDDRMDIDGFTSTEVTMKSNDNDLFHDFMDFDPDESTVDLSDATRLLSRGGVVTLSSTDAAALDGMSAAERARHALSPGRVFDDLPDDETEPTGQDQDPLDGPTPIPSVVDEPAVVTTHNSSDMQPSRLDLDNVAAIAEEDHSGASAHDPATSNTLFLIKIKSLTKK